MSKAESRETLVGVVTLLVVVAVLTFVALGNRVDRTADDAAAVYSAAFARADGLHTGAPVRLAGVTIGRVGEVKLDERFRAIMTLVLTQDIPLPDDTAAVIETDGVFGTKYVELQPGGSEDLLKPGDRIGYTQDSVIIEDLIAKIVAQAKAAAKTAAKTDAAGPN
jgi:phospholipid/cholesterol/gamma-HCH transport system substrate-binding protein